MFQKSKIENITSSVLNSYSQIFFSNNKILASILLVVSFLDVWLGVAGLVSVLIANLLAYIMGYDRKIIEQGIYGFNPLLAGLAVGIYFAASWQAFVLVIFVAILTLFISLVLQGVMAKYTMPFLSLPFLFSVWLLVLGFSEFSNLGISVKDIYQANYLYSLGGLELVKAYEWINNVPIALSLKTYFLSLGAIFFQYNLIAGVLISVGLLLYSRQAFLMSLIGFYAAYGFYIFLGVPTATLNYTYFGFNFILSAIAIGSYFVIPSFKSLLWTIVIIPILVIITIGTDKILGKFMLPIYSLPFNLVVIGFVYSLKLRIYHKKGLKLSVIQHKIPEQNVYFNKINETREYLKYGIKFSLPFFGKWSISQGFNGKYTHKDAWRHAWDFVIINDEGDQYGGTGNLLTDYYCYNKPIIAPADGTVVEIIDGIADNKIGEVNLKQNWGNTLIIQHGTGIFSQFSHIKAGSFKVIKGMFVKRGQILANVGNSGRSPYPHLHFQFQNSNIVGSKTTEVEFNNFLSYNDKEQSFVKSGIPKQDDLVANIEPTYILQKMLKFVPGTKFEAKYFIKNKAVDFKFSADVDFYNNTFLKTNNSKDKLYFIADNSVFSVKNFTGKSKSPLNLIFNSLYFIPLGYYNKVSFKDDLPLHLNNRKLLVLLQDFFVNFYLFLRTDFETEFIEIDDDFSPTKIKIKTQISNYLFGKKISFKKYTILLNTNGFSSIKLHNKKSSKEILWQKEK